LSDDNPAFQSLEQIAERALTFQRYIFRKAWGTYYAVWGAAYLVFAFAWEIPSFLPNLGYWNWIYYTAIYGGIGWLGGIATMLIFKNARRTLLLRKSIEPDINRGRGFARIWIWWVVVYALIFYSFLAFPKFGLSVVFALLFSVDIFIYYSLKLSFQKKFPLEGWVGLISYGACVILSFLFSLLFSTYIFIGITWGITTALWLFCAFYALWRSSEELVALVY
jgi:hypothetical protein